MRTFLRSLSLGLLLAPAHAALAQPAPPYAVTISGIVLGCMPNSAVTIATMPATQPAVDFLIPLGPNCAFDTVVYMDSPGGGFTFTLPCNGAIITTVGQYQIGVFGTANVQVTMTCGNATEDCLGIPNGPNVPGTPCATPSGGVGIWASNCDCQINNTGCQAAFTVASIGPWAMQATSLSMGTAPFTYAWDLPTETSTTANPVYTFTGPGAYGICLTIADAGGCTSVSCDTVFVDANGGITIEPAYYDCLQVPNGPNLPGTPCATPNGVNGIWTSNCDCAPGILTDCLGVPAGPDVPGAPCTLTVGNISYTGFWSTDCTCQVNVPTDCLGVPNGSNIPGSPCQNPATGINGIWSNTCDCVPNTNPDCEAGFWVIQAYSIDSLNPNGGATPIPFELWIWNLSSGGTGNYQFTWDFGDGSSSTEAFPTHVYGSSGPYELCLTMNDGAGCTDTYCDEINVDNDGMLGMVGEGGVRSQLTINVISQLPTSLAEPEAMNAMRAWPNPVEDNLTMAFDNNRSGSFNVTVVDGQGRSVRTTSWSISSGYNRIELPVNDLAAGIYILHLEHAGQVKSLRFVKGR